MTINELDLKKFESKLEGYFKSDSSAKQQINDAMLYSLKAGGKRIRPLLLLEMSRAYGGNMDYANSFAASIEMIHTYSLIHDDLPCMDDDDLRRGKPTNHVVYGEDIAILAGDGLLNKAYEVMMDCVISSNYEVSCIKAMNEILRAAGTEGMILGQVADIKYQGDEITLEMLDFINKHKTGKLIVAAIKAGAIIGGASNEELSKLEDIGENIGLLFQVVDDILDIVGNVEKLGKRTQIDEKNNKITYPMLLGIEKTQELIKELEKVIIADIKTLDVKSEFLIDTVRFLVNRDH